MSLSSLYATLRSYESSASWWRTSASQYQEQMNDTNTALDGKRKQLKLAQATKAQVDLLPASNQTVSDNLTVLGSTLNGAIAEPTAQQRCSDVNKDNADIITRAQTACTTLINNLTTEIGGLEADLDRQTEGYNYSNGRAATYDSYASSMRTRIANYDGD